MRIGCSCIAVKTLIWESPRFPLADRRATAKVLQLFDQVLTCADADELLFIFVNFTEAQPEAFLARFAPSINDKPPASAKSVFVLSSAAKQHAAYALADSLDMKWAEH